MKVTSFFKSNVDLAVVAAQAAVFRHMGIGLEQVMFDRTHGEALDDHVRAFVASALSADVCVIMDVDAIPTIRSKFDALITLARNLNGIVGIRQNSNHFRNSQDYAGPAFLAFTLDAYIRAAQPSFRKSSDGTMEVARQFTRTALEWNVRVRLIDPVRCDHAKWKTESGLDYGPGTTYEGGVYHQSEIRKRGPAATRFIQKCDEVIQTIKDQKNGEGPETGPRN